MSSSTSQVVQVAAWASKAVVDEGCLQGTDDDAIQARVIRISKSADPGPTLRQHAEPSFLTSLTLSSTDALIHLLPSIPSLAGLPIVIHATYTDLADALSLRSAVPYIIHSSNAQQAYDHALLASRLALSAKTLVLHLFSHHTGPKVHHVTDAQVKSFIGSSDYSAAHTNGATAASEYEAAARSTAKLTGRHLQPASYNGPAQPTVVLVTLGDASTIHGALGSHHSGLLDLSLIRPFPTSYILQHLPTTATKVIVLEQVYKRAVKWSPLFLEVTSALAQLPVKVISGTLGHVQSHHASEELSQLLHAAETTHSRQHLTFGHNPATASDIHHATVHVPQHESSYTKLLHHLFGNRLDVVNDPSLVKTLGEVATRPEYALGRIRALDDERSELEKNVRELLEAELHGYASQKELHEGLAKWLTNKNDEHISRSAGDHIVRILETSPPEHPAVLHVLASRKHFPVMSRWIIGSDSWSYDLGASGLHHLIASSANVNILLLDNVPYTARDAADPSKRKKDAGLYAMNHGDAYVASIAVYSSYSQSLHALMEADKHRGASVVLAYLPYQSEEDSALTVLKETKLAVDAGYWPLYRWNPVNPDGSQFQLESDALKADLQEFLDRQNHLSQLVRSQPDIAKELVSSLGTQVQEARREKAKQTYENLLSAMEGPPLLVLYASDGGNAEKIAKRLIGRAKVRGLAARALTMDSTSLEELKLEEHVAFVTSTAGQGEPPQNGRDTFRAFTALVAKGEKPFEGTPVKFAVFGMGDSHYWPRPEDAGYYNKPGKDLDARLEALGAERMVPLGLGDDQDPDGPQTGYKLWEPLLWKALGVDGIEVLEAEPEPITNEHIKIASNFLRGTIVEGLKDTSTGALAPSDGQLTKFHGIYQQDDRDIRDERQDAGLEPAYSFMIRCRLPGGVCTPQQWLAIDRIADERGNGTFKLTTRQTFQFHGIIKKHLKPSIQAINKGLMDTIAACGDVNRTVLCSALPTLTHLHTEVAAFAKRLSEHLLPRMTAYHEIWLDKKMVAGDAFKIAVAVPPTNDVDVFTNDVGFIAITDKHEKLVGFNVTAGGGMGVTHSNKKTYPRTADILGFCPADQGHKVAEAIMLTQRDNGNRADRKNARLKYTIDRMGVEAFKAEVERRLGWPLEPARPFTFTSNIDTFGWTKGHDGFHNFTMFIENGRVEDEPGKEFKTGLREIAQHHTGKFRLTANQHLILADVTEAQLPLMKELLAKHKLDNLAFSALRLSSSACVAFPTCGLAMAESERYLPVLVGKVEKICEENGLRHDSIVMRMTGCPNGCARPWVAEVAFVGKAPGSYLMLLGGGYYGQRLNKIYRENVTEPEILAILAPMIKRYALERHDGERFGDFVIRAGYISATKSGKEFYDRMGGEGVHRSAA
ncbi:hypothetical protein FRB98_009467 [Tulasnella sp. 332]|nr:hypothetical protein FRB98_009467 [Tulasnella sp. 332]